jgi:hypothetical protein
MYKLKYLVPIMLLQNRPECVEESQERDSVRSRLDAMDLTFRLDLGGVSIHVAGDRWRVCVLVSLREPACAPHVSPLASGPYRRPVA